MTKKTVKISLKPLKTLFIFIIIVVIVGLVYFAKSKSKNTAENQAELADSRKEIIVPRETGVADSGFELKNASISALNAKAVLDTLEEISGKQSLKIYFLDGANASVKIGNYINEIEKDNFYRLSFWARSDSAEEKNILASISGGDGSKMLGDFSLADNSGTRYFEFNFQAENSASDLIFTSTDGKKSNVWIDDVMMEKINVAASEQLTNVKPTVFGNTARFNVDQGQTEEDGDSEDFFAITNRKMGQIFQPTQSIISSVSLKIQKNGKGGTGSYHLQIREYDENMGIISDNLIATRIIYTDYPASLLDEIKSKEQEMKDAFDQNESDIKQGRTPNDPTVDQYPADFTQQQIDESKAQKRNEKLILAIDEMKESFNVPYELNIPISAKLNTGKKYWVGVDSAGVKTDKRNYIKVFNSNGGNEPGFISQEPGVWKENDSLWFKTFYPRHAQAENENILSGATIADLGDSLIYRYKFDEDDYSALSGFPGRKIYDIFDSNFSQSDELGNYTLSSEQYAVYKFNTLYPAKKIIIRNANYSQSLAINFSSDGENWREVFSDNPEENNRSINPILIYPDSETKAFYLKIMPAGSSTILSELSLEAELLR